MQTRAQDPPCFAHCRRTKRRSTRRQQKDAQKHGGEQESRPERALCSSAILGNNVLSRKLWSRAQNQFSCFASPRCVEQHFCPSSMFLVLLTPPTYYLPCTKGRSLHRFSAPITASSAALSNCSPFLFLVLLSSELAPLLACRGHFFDCDSQHCTYHNRCRPSTASWRL